MTERGRLRDTAKNSRWMEDWRVYRTARNNCVKLITKSKTDLYRKLYEKLATEKTTKKLYSLTKELIQMKNGNTPQQQTTTFPGVSAF